MMKKLLALVPTFSLAPALAMAHDGTHGLGFAVGLAHPLGGLDHVLAMVAVGLWAAMVGGRALWALPVAFVGAMVLGGVLGASAVMLPGTEPMILSSIVILGVLAALALRLPMGAALAVVAVFGLFHGHAHGAEGPAEGLALYAVGFAFSTMALHAAGLALGLALNAVSARSVVRVLGAGTAVAGLSLALV